MKNKVILFTLVFLLLIINACTPAPGEVTPPEPGKVIEVEEEEETAEGVIEIKEMPAEVKELLSIADERVESLRYDYKGPQTQNFVYKFFVRDDMVKYKPYPAYKTLDLDDDAYDTIYFNKETKTAAAYCDDRKCRVNGKKADLNYDDVYIWTPLDWLENIEYAEKAGEQLMDGGRKNTWKLSTSNLGTIWVHTFSGVPVQAKLAGNEYQFLNLVFDDVAEEDVTPEEIVIAEEEGVWECPNQRNIDCTLPIPIETQEYCIGEYANWINENCNITVTY